MHLKCEEYEAVIGLEVHCQLATETKIFCGCRAKTPEGISVADIESNLNTCPICAGHLGTLPVMNQKAIEYAVMAGLATGCQIRPLSVFARKNYFYPDLPKGYQITQFDQPICEWGELDIDSKRVGIRRIHLEEDAGKNIHLSGFSLVNLNRAGVPLIEIVSEPCMNTPAEAGAYLRALHAVMTFLGITDGNMQEGNFRCDANVSVRLKGSKELGTRTEIKNVNSFRFVEKAIEYETHRQVNLIQSGGKVVQETRSYDSDKNTTFSMRSKEEAQDYRYFPDPDLIPIRLKSEWIEKLRRSLPELPEQKRKRWVQGFGAFGLSMEDAVILTSSQSMTQFFEEILQHPHAKEIAKSAANWLTGEVTRLLSEEGTDLAQSKLTPTHLIDLVEAVQKQVLSSTGAKQVLGTFWKTGEPVSQIIQDQGLAQVSDVAALDPIMNKIIAANPKQVAEYRSGKEKLLGFFVGQTMKETGGKANPALLGELLKKKLME